MNNSLYNNVYLPPLQSVTLREINLYNDNNRTIIYLLHKLHLFFDTKQNEFFQVYFIPRPSSLIKRFYGKAVFLSSMIKSSYWKLSISHIILRNNFKLDFLNQKTQFLKIFLHLDIIVKWLLKYSYFLDNTLHLNERIEFS